MVGYWAADLPDVSPLHFKSFARFGDGWRYVLFLRDLYGPRQSGEDIRAITGDQLEIVRIDLVSRLADLRLPPIGIAQSPFNAPR